MDDAYDPIRDRDVPIECHPAHQPTDASTIDGDTLPVVTKSDFRHDPVEGCQGQYEEIIEIPDGCPVCGYDRADHGVHTLAGIHRETCRACGTDITDRNREDVDTSSDSDSDSDSDTTTDDS